MLHCSAERVRWFYTALSSHHMLHCSAERVRWFYTALSSHHMLHCSAERVRWFYTALSPHHTLHCSALRVRWFNTALSPYHTPHCSARKVIGFYTALSPHHALPETLKGLDYGHIYTINLITPTPHALKHWKDRTIVLESIKPTPHTPLLWWKALDWWKQCGSIDLRTLFPSLAKCKHTVAFLRLLVHKICTHLKCIPVPTSTVNLLWLIQTVWTLRRRRKEEVEDLMQNITTMVYLYLGLW